MKREPWDEYRIAKRLRWIIEQSGVEEDDRRLIYARRLYSQGKSRLADKVLEPLIDKIAEREMDGRVLPVRRNLPQTGIHVCRASAGREDGAEVFLPEARPGLTPNLGIFGPPGSGKSVLKHYLALQFIDQGHPVWLIDPEGEDRCLLPLFSRDRLWSLHGSDWEINLLKTKDELHAHAGWLAGFLRSVYAMQEGGESVLISSLGWLYRERDCPDSENWPTMGDLLNVLHAKKKKSPPRALGWTETAIRAVSTVCDRMPFLNTRTSMPMEALASRSCIIDVSDMESQETEFLLCLLLRLVGEVPGKPLIIFIDESHLYLTKQREARSSIGEAPLQVTARRLRKRNCGLVLLNQTAHLLPASIIATLGTIITFPLKDYPDIWVVAKAIGLDEQKARAFQLMPKRYVLVSTQELGEPILGKVPEIRLPRPPPQEKVEVDMRPCLDALRPEPSHLAVPQVHDVAPEITEEPDPASILDDRPENPLHPDQTKLLIRILEHFEDTITERCQALEWDRNRELRARKKLDQLGLIFEAGKLGKLTFFAPTDKALDLAEKLGLPQPPKFKSGYFHEILLRRLNRVLEAQVPGIEFQKPGQVRDVQADLWVAVQEFRLAIQVSVTNSAGNEAEALMRLAGVAEVDGVILIAAEKKKAAAIQTELRRLVELSGKEGLFDRQPSPVRKCRILDAETSLAKPFDWPGLMEELGGPSR